MEIQKAGVTDIRAMKALIDSFASRNLMLSRSLSAMYQNVRDYRICVDGGKIVGCVALHVMWEDLAEVKSLAVDETYHGKGIGKLLVDDALAEARALRLPRVFCLTYVPDFFGKCGFRRIDKATLPHSVWAECVNCSKFPDCDEIAMALDL
jgi:amino-acid N-acetyltransferase